MTAPHTELSLSLAQHLINTHGVAIAHIGPDLTIIDCSTSFGDFLETPDVNPIGQPLNHVFWEFVGSENVLEDLLAGKQRRYTIENVWREDRPQQRYFSFEVAPLNSERPESGLLLIVRDTTRAGVLEQRMVQERNELRLTRAKLRLANAELQRLSRLKSLFFSMAAHDLRTPLTVIQGFANLLRDQSGSDHNPTQVEYLNIIAMQSEWLDHLIADLLALNQIESGQLQLQLQACELNSVATSIVDLMTTAASLSERALHLEPAPDTTVAFADIRRLKQILFNLIDNAIKYTARNGRIIVSVLDEDPNYAGLRVGDNGRGLTPEEQSHLFELYYRTEDAKKGAARGSGLGLHIVQMLVKAHNGRIEVDSMPGEGTAFTLWLPRTEETLLGS